jgi:8-oxo-dGTP diphosphatase
MSVSPEKSVHDRTVTVVTVFGVLLKDGKVLMIRRAQEPYLGLCTVPGGHKLHGESLKEACIREMQEETGLTLVNPSLIGFMEVEMENDPRDFISFYFSAHGWDGLLTSSREGELFWASLEEARDSEQTHPAFKALSSCFYGQKEQFMARALVNRLGQGSYDVNSF